MTPAEIERVIAAVLHEIGAAPRGQQPVAPPPAAVPDIPALIDHTLLSPVAAQTDIEALCREAIDHGFATVCVNPYWVGTCAAATRGSGVKVCTVVGFPLGATMIEVKGFEAARAIAAGAREVDMVLNIGALKSAQLRIVARDIEAVTKVCKEAGARSKVIIEAALLTDVEKIAACTIAAVAGADYVKTSTGFAPSGATVADVALMRQVVGASVGVKAAGGIRDLDTVRAMVAAGATRIGTSAGVRIAEELRGRAVTSGHGDY